MITTLAIMIAVAGYLNFAGAKIGEADFISTDGSDSALSYEISDEDNMLAISLNDDGENTVSDHYLSLYLTSFCRCQDDRIW